MLALQLPDGCRRTTGNDSCIVLVHSQSLEEFDLLQHRPQLFRLLPSSMLQT